MARHLDRFAPSCRSEAVIVGVDVEPPEQHVSRRHLVDQRVQPGDEQEFVVRRLARLGERLVPARASTANPDVSSVREVLPHGLRHSKSRASQRADAARHARAAGRRPWRRRCSVLANDGHTLRVRRRDAGSRIDQILAEPCDPKLYEPKMDDARDYVAIAEDISGPIPRPAPPEYPWGEALAIFDAVRPDARIVNLETSITHRGEHDPEKRIHYRVSPTNAACLAAARVDVCTLANNHVLDWGAARAHRHARHARPSAHPALRRGSRSRRSDSPGGDRPRRARPYRGVFGRLLRRWCPAVVVGYRGFDRACNTLVDLRGLHAKVAARDRALAPAAHRSSCSRSIGDRTGASRSRRRIVGSRTT